MIPAAATRDSSHRLPVATGIEYGDDRRSIPNAVKRRANSITLPVVMPDEDFSWDRFGDASLQAPLPSVVRTPSRAPTPIRPTRFGDKLNAFRQLICERPMYRRTMSAAWIHSAGNGMLNATYMCLLATLKGSNPSRSFLAIAIKDLGQTAVFCGVSIVGAHRIDNARPISPELDAQRRNGFLRELQSICWVDLGLSVGLSFVAFAPPSLAAMPLVLTGLLVGIRLSQACKSVYETSLFLCVRQLLGSETLGDLVTPADRMIPNLEHTVAAFSYEFISCSTQFLILSVLPPPYRHAAAAAAACMGALLAASPKWYLAHRGVDG